jgi:hypothetical protein
MKMEDVLDHYQYYSGKASDIVRQLGFAGVALIWVFRTDVGGKHTIPQQLLPAAESIVFALGLDLLHYVSGTLIWGIYNSRKEAAGTDNDTDFMAPRPINWATLFFFWAKILAMISAYVYILRFLMFEFN